MWSYNFVVPNLILLGTFLVFYLLEPHLPVSKNRSFLRLVLAEIFVLILDLVSVKCLDNFAAYPVNLHITLNVLYFIAFLFRIAFFFHFTVVLFCTRYKKSPKIMLITYSVFLICVGFAVANLSVPTLFVIDSSGYHKWKFYNLIYICSYFYILLIFILLFAHRRELKKQALICATVYNLILFAGYIVRQLFSRYLIMDFFCMMAIVIIYLSFENSAYYIETKTGAFNLLSLEALLKESKKVHSLILGITIRDYEGMREIYSGSKLDIGISLIADFLKKNYSRLSVFYINNGRFVLVGNTDNYSVELIKEEIKNRFNYPWQQEQTDMELFLEVRFVEVDKELHSSDSTILLQGLLSAFNLLNNALDSDMQISDETLKMIERNTEVKRIVRNAVETKKVEMFLQPLISAKTNRVTGAEALARVRNANGEIMPPGIFIPVAEKNGYINLLGEQMFERACEFVSTHDMEALGLSCINVNLSPVQFLQNDLCTKFSEILKKYNVDADKIHLEITEEAMIDYALLQKQIQIMKNTGFEFVLDDFGSGYSNVTRLKHYPFINIKVDMEVVWDYFKTHEAILPALVKAFKNMGFTVTAEGIENKEMAEGMKSLGCDYLQGFYFSSPIPAEEFAQKYSGNAGK